VGAEQRAAQRIDLPEPVPAKIGDVEAKIVEVSLVGCRAEHAERLAIGAIVPVYFQWRGEPVQLSGKVARTELRSAGGRMMYSTGLQFATSVDTSPDAIRRIMASLVKTSVAERPATAPVPVFFERAPFFRDEEEEQKPAPKPVPAAPLPRPSPPPPVIVPRPEPVVAVAPMMDEAAEVDIGGPSFELDFNPAASPTHPDLMDEPVIASRSFELDAGEFTTTFAEEAKAESGVEEAAARYVRCTIEEGKWTVEQTREPKQPREGFTIADPGDQREIDQFCKTYEVADPDTRRMIRVSCELMIAQSGS
jgi:hypothetical protein